MTDKQFNDAFTAAGGWFTLTQYETIADWAGEKSDLSDHLFAQGFDVSRKNTSTRLASVTRLIRENRIEDAIIKCRDSETINRQHPDAFQRAEDILRKRF